MDYYLGIDIGGTKTAVVIGSCAPGDELTIHGRHEVPTGELSSPGDAVGRIGDLATSLLRSVGGPASTSSLTRAGISCGGPLDGRRGVILSPPNLPGWDEVPITQLVADRLRVPAALMNDADAGALAEYRLGRGRGRKNLCFLTFGTGIGAGLILNGAVYEGSTNAAGEIGHVRLSEWGPVGYGKAGSFEGFCSGGGIVQLAHTILLEQEQRGKRSSSLHEADNRAAITARDVFEAAGAGDALARHIVDVVADHLGRGLAVLVDVLNPELIILGGIFGRAERLLRPGMEAALEREAISSSVATCEIAPAALGGQIGDYAALCVALEGRT